MKDRCLCFEQTYSLQKTSKTSFTVYICIKNYSPQNDLNIQGITIHYGYVKITWDVPTILHSLSIFISKSEIFGYFRSILLGLMEFELTNDV